MQWGKEGHICFRGVPVVVVVMEVALTIYSTHNSQL